MSLAYPIADFTIRAGVVGICFAVGIGIGALLNRRPR